MLLLSRNLLKSVPKLIEIHIPRLLVCYIQMTSPTRVFSLFCAINVVQAAVQLGCYNSDMLIDMQQLHDR